MPTKIVLSAGLLATSLFGQRIVNTGPSLLPPPNASRFGNILFPGGTPAAIPPAPRLGSLIPNHGQFQGGFISPPSRPNGRQNGRDRTVVVPYAFPVYLSDFGYNNYQNNPPQPPITIVVPQQQQTVPTVIINQTFASDTPQTTEEEPAANPSSSVRIYKTPVREPSAPPEPVTRAARDTSGDDRATIFLIALKDGSIHSAIGYWVEDSTLHYVTQQGTVNRVTLDQVDKPLSDQLNSERKVDFQLRPK
jgi:hypothetical protein